MVASGGDGPRTRWHQRSLDMVKIVSGCGLVISMLALFFAWQAYDQLDQRADDALARREKALVQEWEPLVRQIYSDYDVDCPSSSPDTLEELLRPLITIVGSVQPPSQIVEALSSRNRNVVYVALDTLKENGIGASEQIDVHEAFADAQPALGVLIDEVTSLDDDERDSLDRAYADRLLIYSPIWSDAYWE